MRTLSDIFAAIVATVAVSAVAAFAFVLLFLVGLLDAVVIADTWRWFAVPFLGVKPLSVGAAFGLNLVVWSFIRRSSEWSTTSKTTKESLSKIATLVAGILLGWGVAYLVARFWTHTL